MSEVAKRMVLRKGSCQKYATFDQFLQEFTEYNQEVNDVEPPILDFSISDSHKIRLYFSGVRENSTEYEDLDLEISSSDGNELRFLDFMYLMNNATYPFLCNVDHHFYEGIEELESDDDVPSFELILGS